MLGKIGTTELVIILVIALVIFGPKQLPKLGKTFGSTIKGFKDGVENEEIEITEMKEES
ncbi:MAG TPA: twin-arginine translocase TatA/TatE family subunit [Eubacteriaceae bacterium]|nr:twin-arginine translocase TatA/TatE family subunit [Eubacteriaceae bacterium]